RQHIHDQHHTQSHVVQASELLSLSEGFRPRIFLSCGEPSGDLYAGALTRELRTLAPRCEVTGRGGPEFVRGGGRLLADYRGLAITGFTEIVTKVPALN